jgi:hypothetical protein
LERDALAAGWEPEITKLKNLIHLRREAVAGEFQTWTRSVFSQLEPALAAELQEAAAKVKESDDLRSSIDLITRCVSRVADADTPNVLALQLLNVAAVVKNALAIGAEA